MRDNAEWKEWGPICPVCECPYGEHHRDCPVEDGYNDCNEGPWPTQEAAELFAQAEVGAASKVVRGKDGQFYVMARTEE